MTDESSGASGTTEGGRMRVLPALLLPVAVFVALTAISWWLPATSLNRFAHLLNPFNPLTQAYGLDWSMFGTSFVVALVLGVVRERMDGLLTVALLHFGITLFPKMFQVTPVSGTAMLLAWLVTLVVLLRKLLGGRRPDTETA